MADDSRWAHLVNAAFLLDQAPRASGPESLRPVLTLLQSALEVFPPSIDPVEDFEGYSVRRLLLALEDSLSHTLRGGT